MMVEVQELQGQLRYDRPIESIFTEFEHEDYFNVNLFTPDQWNYFNNDICWVLCVHFKEHHYTNENVITHLCHHFEGIVQRNMLCDSITAIGEFEDLLVVAYAWMDCIKDFDGRYVEIITWAPFRIHEYIRVCYPFPHSEEHVDWNKFVQIYQVIKNLWFSDFGKRNIGRYNRDYYYSREQLALHLTINGLQQFIKECEKNGVRVID
jgi:hypothetical protein